MTARTPFALLLSCSIAALSACGESEEPDTAPLSGAVQEATEAAEDAAGAAESAAEDAPGAAENAPGQDSQAGQEALADYISGMEELNSVARSITDTLSAASKTPEVQAALDKVKEAWAALDELNPELKQQLIQLSDSKLDAITSTLKSEAQRLADELGLPDLVAMLNEAPMPDGA